jgi:hypothetical protein
MRPFIGVCLLLALFALSGCGVFGERSRVDAEPPEPVTPTLPPMVDLSDGDNEAE